ncbi:hypothetical protein L7F22_058817 [Adiantum nelumboides]|nr:hypothetical protein [Adiantum nelumboides]
MTPRELAMEKKFTHNNYEPELYELMERCTGHDPVLDPPPSVVDTSNVAIGRQHSSTTPTGNVATSPQPPAGGNAFEDITTFERTSTNGGVPKKARTRTHVLDVGLQEATINMTNAMQDAERGKQIQHGEAMQVAGLYVDAVGGMSATLSKIADKL